MPRWPDSVSAAQDRPPRGSRLRPRQRAAKARRQGQARRAMRAARKQPPPPRKGCLRANHCPPRPQRQPLGLPGPRAPARNAPPGRTTECRARRPHGHDGTRRSPGPRPDLASRPAAPLHTRCRTGPAASSDRRWGIAHRHARQASARIVPSGSRQRQPQLGTAPLPDPGPPVPGGYCVPGAGAGVWTPQSTWAATGRQSCWRSHDVRSTRPAMTKIVAAMVNITPRQVGSVYPLSTPRSYAPGRFH